MKFIILKKDKDSTIARNDSVFPVNNFFVVLTLVSSLANSFGIFFPTISHSGNVIEMCLPEKYRPENRITELAMMKEG